MACLSTEEMSQRVGIFVRDGHLCPVQGRAFNTPLVREDAVSVLFMVVLFAIIGPDPNIDRYLISFAKEDGALLFTAPISLDIDEMANILRESGCGELIHQQAIHNGSFGITYAAKAHRKNETKPGQYIVQLRYHSNVDSMYHLIKYIREKAPEGLPVPYLFPTPTPPKPVFGVQISQCVPGNVGSNTLCGETFSILGPLPLEGKIKVVKQMARAFAALWGLPVPGAGNVIGEATVSPEGTVTVGPERRYGLGGPFPSVTSYLQAWIRHRIDKLQEKRAIDESEDKSLDEYLGRIIQCAETSLNHIPMEVENVKLALAVIDWEFVDHAPPLIAIPTLIEPTFELSPSASGDLREAFWNEIPLWKQAFETKGSQIFLDFYSLGFYLDPHTLLGDYLDLAEKEEYWEKNKQFLEQFLEK
ncbi:unnamed protein product [Penicillium bialowiezense]